jgi:hypothetical protein
MIDTGSATALVTIRTFGASGTYSKGTAAAVPMKIIIDRDVLREAEGGAYVRQTTASFLSGQVTVAQGDRVTVGDESWRVDVLDADDGFVTTVILGRKT